MRIRSDQGSTALLMDFYELTMASGYWKAGLAEHEVVFHVVFRKNPFGGGFTVACGLETAMDWLSRFRFDPWDLDYLVSLPGAGGRPLFEPSFLDVLKDIRFSCDVDAVPEGTVVFPQEPLIRVQGPLLQAQLFETALLNILNFQSLVATKAARIRLAAGSDPVIEFGARRAQGFDGAVSAGRAAYVGGADATSDVLVGKRFGIPVRGTMAHSWVMAFDGEPAAFRAYADAFPDQSLFLVDTYDTIEGVRHAVEAGKELRRRGHEMMGVRLDSGDLLALSVEARRILDEGGFPRTVILASNELDEAAIRALKHRGAPIGAWGVGTRLVTGHPDGALGGVYKLAAIRPRGGEWEYKLKLSDQADKTSTPGILQVRRFLDRRTAVADMVFDVDADPGDGPTLIDPSGAARRRMPGGTACEDLLVPIFRHGRRAYDPPPLPAVREKMLRSLSVLPDGIKRPDGPEAYFLGFDASLYGRKAWLTSEVKKGLTAV